VDSFQVDIVMRIRSSEEFHISTYPLLNIVISIFGKKFHEKKISIYLRDAKSSGFFKGKKKLGKLNIKMNEYALFDHAKEDTQKFTMETKGGNTAYLYFNVRNQWLKVGRNVIGGREIDRDLLLEKSTSSRLDNFHQEDITESTVDTSSASSEDEDPFGEKDEVKEEVKPKLAEAIVKEEVKKKPPEIEAFDARVARRRQESVLISQSDKTVSLLILKALAGILTLFLAVEILFT